MMTYSAITVDDEQAAHYAMLKLLQKYNEIYLIEQAYNGKQAIEKINKRRPDIVFLDIQMPDMNGFKVLEQLEYQPYIVFCTAYDQYAIEAFSKNSIDYLLKPIEEERFARCIEKVRRFLPQYPKIEISQLQELNKLLNPVKKISAIPIHIGSKIKFVPCEQVAYCLSKDGYTSVFTDEGKEFVINLSLKEMEERLPDDFIRVQKSYIVNRQKIEEIQKYFNNRLILTLKDKSGSKITTGTSYIDTIRRELQL